MIYIKLYYIYHIAYREYINCINVSYTSIYRIYIYRINICSIHILYKCIVYIYRIFIYRLYIIIYI